MQSTITEIISIALLVVIVVGVLLASRYIKRQQLFLQLRREVYSQKMYLTFHMLWWVAVDADATQKRRWATYGKWIPKFPLPPTYLELLGIVPYRYLTADGSKRIVVPTEQGDMWLVLEEALPDDNLILNYFSMRDNDLTYSRYVNELDHGETLLSQLSALHVNALSATN